MITLETAQEFVGHIVGFQYENEQREVAVEKAFVAKTTGNLVITGLDSGRECKYRSFNVADIQDGSIGVRATLETAGLQMVNGRIKPIV